jgi:hypothetical protein
MEEVAAKRPEEVRAPAVTTKPLEARWSRPAGLPPQPILYNSPDGAAAEDVFRLTVAASGEP